MVLELGTLGIGNNKIRFGWRYIVRMLMILTVWVRQCKQKVFELLLARFTEIMLREMLMGM